MYMLECIILTVKQDNMKHFQAHLYHYKISLKMNLKHAGDPILCEVLFQQWLREY